MEGVTLVAEFGVVSGERDVHGDWLGGGVGASDPVIIVVGGVVIVGDEKRARCEEGEGWEQRAVIRTEFGDGDGDRRVLRRVKEDEGIEERLVGGEVTFDGRGGREEERREGQRGREREASGALRLDGDEKIAGDGGALEFDGEGGVVVSGGGGDHGGGGGHVQCLERSGVAAVNGDGRGDGVVVRPVVGDVREGERDGLQRARGLGGHPEGEGGQSGARRRRRGDGRAVVKYGHGGVVTVDHRQGEGGRRGTRFQQQVLHGAETEFGGISGDCEGEGRGAAMRGDVFPLAAEGLGVRVGVEADVAAGTNGHVAGVVLEEQREGVVFVQHHRGQVQHHIGS